MRAPLVVPDDGSMTSQTVTSADGTSVGYWTSGDGPPLVLVHGTTADHTRWRSVLPLLEPHARVHALDRRGRGGSGDHPDYALDREFEDVAAVIRAVAESTDGPVGLLGHSYGALAALGAARLAAAAVGRLVLYEPPAGSEGRDVSSGVLERLEELVGQGRPEQVLEVFFRDEVGVPEQQLELLRRLPAWPARVAAAHTIPRELRATGQFGHDPDWFAGVEAPTLLLLGGDSPPWAAEATEQIRTALTDARVELLPGQQHLAMDTAPELFTDRVLEFLPHRDGGRR
jgi:pimeloyl-ACP methyl ester carboxylesterase